MKEHLGPGTFRAGRMKHEAGKEPQVRERILNLVEAEVGEKGREITVELIHGHQGAAHGRKAETLILPNVPSA